jgi:type IV pilus assembly protein PilB
MSRRGGRPSDDLQEFLVMAGLPSDRVIRGKGCERCRQTGYSGRLGLYELLLLDDQLRDIIARSPNVTEFRRTCIERGMITLRQDGLVKVGSGLTTVEEVMRVTEATI